VIEAPRDGFEKGKAKAEPPADSTPLQAEDPTAQARMPKPAAAPDKTAGNLPINVDIFLDLLRREVLGTTATWHGDESVYLHNPRLFHGHPDSAYRRDAARTARSLANASSATRQAAPAALTHLARFLEKLDDVSFVDRRLSRAPYSYVDALQKLSEDVSKDTVPAASKSEPTQAQTAPVLKQSAPVLKSGECQLFQYIERHEDWSIPNSTAKGISAYTGDGLAHHALDEVRAVRSPVFALRGPQGWQSLGLHALIHKLHRDIRGLPEVRAGNVRQDPKTAILRDLKATILQLPLANERLLCLLHLAHALNEPGALGERVALQAQAACLAEVVDQAGAALHCGDHETVRNALEALGEAARTEMPLSTKAAFSGLDLVQECLRRPDFKKGPWLDVALTRLGMAATSHPQERRQSTENVVDRVLQLAATEGVHASEARLGHLAVICLERLLFSPTTLFNDQGRGRALFERVRDVVDRDPASPMKIRAMLTLGRLAHAPIAQQPKDLRRQLLKALQRIRWDNPTEEELNDVSQALRSGSIPDPMKPVLDVLRAWVSEQCALRGIRGPVIDTRPRSSGIEP
jgi:hypothetical protein